jgi:large conductance mechanosensitive channel
MLEEFRKFAMRGNVIDLAVGLIIGAAFGKIVTSLVNDIIMPVLNPLIPGGDWRTIEIGPGLKIGSFLGTLLDFIFIAFAVFLIVRTINRLKKKEEAKPPGPAELPPDVKLLTEIRDLLARERGRTSEE